MLPGIPPYGSGGWAWFSVAEAQRSNKVIPAATNGENPFRVCPQRRVERMAGEGILHAVETRDDHLSDGRNARTVLRRLDALDLCHLPGNNPSRVCPPAGWIGWLEKGSHMLLKRDKIAADRRNAKTVIHHSDSSDLCFLPGAVASC